MLARALRLQGVLRRRSGAAKSALAPRQGSFSRDIARALWRLVPGGRFLDFSSGHGDMLIAAREIGYQAEGLDGSRELAAGAMERSLCPVFVGSMHDAEYADDTFDVINSQLTLEQVPDLVETVRELARVLAPGGLLRVGALTADSPRGLVLSEHTFRFLGAQTGLELTHVIDGGEQSPASFLAERADPSALESAVDLARYYLARRLSLTSCRAFYLRKLRSLH